MYSEKVMDHFANPRNVGELENANGIGEVGNAKCGDIMRIYLDVQDNIIKDVKFKTFGCGAAIATSSMVTELVMGKTLEEALKILRNPGEKLVSGGIVDSFEAINDTGRFVNAETSRLNLAESPQLVKEAEDHLSRVLRDELL